MVAALRPGVALGDYPELEPDTPGLADRVAGAILRRVSPGTRPLRAAALRAFVAEVDRQESLLAGDELPDREIIQSLRRSLVREGLEDELVARSFALTRRAAAAKLGLSHYPSQLMAGRVMLSGALAEMQTGEGKTLAATLPACAAALAGIPVHVVTANDYLVTRDAAAMAPVYRALGLRVGAITESSTPEMRRDSYARDVTYVTSKQLAFDYLRDRIARRERRGAIRTRLESLGGRLTPAGGLLMRGLCFAIIDEADSVLIDEARTPFVIAAERMDATLDDRCAAALAAARKLSRDEDFVLDPGRRRAQLTQRGSERIGDNDGALPDNHAQRMAIVEQALCALHFFHRDHEYLVRDGKVQIIDPLSGRVMADRSWNRGLQQMIECKESCTLTAPRDTLARMTYQRFFRRYLRLSGMTGTAREVADELWSTYGQRVVEIPTHRPCLRKHFPPTVSASAAPRAQALVARVRDLHDTGRPVLIGTRSVADSEHLGVLLRKAGLPHEILNARQDADEARIVALAGQGGQITVATNMAGRGTDIELGDGVAAAGGLHVIVAELNDAARLDRQLAGRCARQGQSGSVEVFLSPDDDLIRNFYSPRLRRWLGTACATKFGKLMLIRLAKATQKRCERRHRNERRDLATMQDRIDKLLSFTGQPE